MSLRAWLMIFAATAVAVAVTLSLWLLRSGNGVGEEETQLQDRMHDELDSRGPCPPALPKPTDDSGYGFGSDSPADTSPGLSEQSQAWSCVYEAVGAPREDGNGTYYTWDLTAGPSALDESVIPALVSAVNKLKPPPGEYGCNMDLGPRYLVVFATESGNVTGVSIDRYGCREVRMTANPWDGAPGENPSPGVPSGVLFDGRAMLSLLNVE